MTILSSTQDSNQQSSGWRRLLIVISIAWLVAVGGLVWHEHSPQKPSEQRHRTFWHKTMVGTCAYTDAFHCKNVATHEEDQNIDSDEMSAPIMVGDKFFIYSLYKLKVNIKAVLFATLLPIAGLWLCFSAARWVRSGFISAPRNSGGVLLPQAKAGHPNNAALEADSPTTGEASISPQQASASWKLISWPGALLGASSSAYFGKTHGGLAASALFIIFYFVGRELSNILKNWAQLINPALAKERSFALSKPKKVWLLALLVLAVIYLLVLLPLSVFTSSFEPKYSFVILFWIGIFGYSYTRLLGIKLV